MPPSMTPATSALPLISAASGRRPFGAVRLDPVGDEIDRLGQPRLPERAHQRMGVLRLQQRLGAGAKPGRIAIVLLHPGLEHGVDGAAPPGGARIGIDRIERHQAEHLAGVEGVGIGLQPVDLGDRDGARTVADRRRRRRPLRRRVGFGAVDRARPFAQVRARG